MTRSILTRLAALVLFAIVTLSACGDDVIAPPNQGPTITVTAPNGGEAVAPGSVLNITWTVNDPDGTIAGIDLSYTADGVTATSIASGVSGTTFAWTVPATALYGVRVTAVATDDGGATASDDSDAIFAIVAASARGYVTSSTCQDCHASNYTEVFSSGHPYKLSKVVGGVSPTIPNSPGVPNPPSGFTWNDITYMIGGYGWKARFMDSEGYIITDGWNGVNAQYNLPRADLGGPGGLLAAWTAYEGSNPVRKPYTCGSCHTTGWLSFTDNGGVNQDGLAGIYGTWEEPGITCEACHGPGVDHVVAQTAAAITVDPTAELCGNCHFRDTNHRILAGGGFIQHHEQFDELVNGGKRTFDCTTCHDPHIGTRYGNANAGGIVQDCESCHPNELANNQHVVAVDCENCHMGRGSKSARSVHTFEGDIRTHIFTINTNPWPKDSMFYFDPGESKTFAKDFVTLDVACYSCHTDPITLEGGGGSQQSLGALSARATGIHN